MRVGEPATKKRVPKGFLEKAQNKADSNPYVCVLTHAIIIGLLDELVHHPVAL